MIRMIYAFFIRSGSSGRAFRSRLEMPKLRMTIARSEDIGHVQIEVSGGARKIVARMIPATAEALTRA